MYHAIMLLHSMHKLMSSILLSVMKLLSSKANVLITVMIITALLIRFYDAPNRLSEFGWDQARDAQKVDSILDGNLQFQGPRTGIGHMHIGALHYYFLAPFYLLTDRDPIAAYYYVIIINILYLISAAVVFKKLFGYKASVFATYIYCFNDYIAYIGRNPWNVTMGIAIGLWIFYVAMKYMGTRKSYHLIWFGVLTGLYFHSHFSFIFYLPLLAVLFLIFGRTRKSFVHVIVGIILMIIFMSGNIYSEIVNHNSDINRYHEFWNNYFIGFHMQFFLHRLPYNLVMVEKIIANSYGWILKYVFVIMFGILTYVRRSDEKVRRIALLALILIGVPAIGYSIYGGTLSEYYYIFQFPIIIAMMWYMGSTLYQWLPQSYNKLYVVILMILGLMYAYVNVKPMVMYRESKSIQQQKDDILSQVKDGKVIKWEEGKMDSYLYFWYIVHKKIKPTNKY